MKISVVINTFNADRCLDSVLKSVVDYDEIIVCDMYSEDRTIEIAKTHNCTIIYHERTGIVEPARLYAISKARHDWVLVVDADECIQKPLKEYLIQTVKDNPNIGGVRIPRMNYFLGRLMHAGNPGYITRFVKKEGLEWPSRIHTRPIVQGEVFLVPRNRTDLAFIHYGVPSISSNIGKMNVYTNFEVDRRMKRSNGFLSLTFGSMSRFFRAYILKGGFRDGLPGLIWSIDAAIYKFYATAKAVETATAVDDYDPIFKSFFETDLKETTKE